MGSYVSVLRRRLAYILVIAAALTPLLYFALTPERSYASTAVVQTGNTLAAGVIGVNTPYEEPENRLATEVEIFGSEAVAERAATTLADQGWTAPASDLADQVTMTPRGLSTLLDVRGTAETPERAQALTTAFLDAYLAERREAQQATLESVVTGLEAQRDEAEAALLALGDVTEATPDVQRQAATLQSWSDTLNARIQQARLRLSVDTSGVTPATTASMGEEVGGLGTTTALIAAGVGALLVAMGLAMLLDAWGNPVRTRREAQELLGLPVVGELPRVGSGGYRPDRALGDPRHPAAAAARGLRLRVAGLVEPPPRTVLVAALPGNAHDGLHAAAALAAATGRSGMQVALVVDPDSHGQRWARALRTRGEPVPVGSNGLTAMATGLAGVWLLPATPGDRPGLLDVPSPREAVDELHEAFDLVVLVDVRPGAPDGIGLGEIADVALVVAVLENTPAGRLEELRRTLEDFGATVDGVVVARAWRRRALASRAVAGPAPSRDELADDDAVPVGVGDDDPAAVR